MPVITEAQLRAYNNLCNPYPFTMVTAIPPPTPSYLSAYNTNQTKPNLLKILPTDDTWHDLAQPRKDYDPTYFNGLVANYLMTGDYNVPLDKISFYQKAMNYPSFSDGSFPSMRYEAKVAASFEQQHGLQRATEVITYGEIYRFFDGNTIDPLLVNKLILSNGSLIIIPGPELNTFADFIAQYEDQEKPRVLLVIAGFIKWYLHSAQYDTLVQGAKFDGVDVPQEIRISADAGFFQLREIFSPAGSGGIPFITIPNILDSAGTTIEPLDPTRDIYYEPTDYTTVYPIVSNYFSSNNIFLCYAINPGKQFGVDGGSYCFSLCILNINANDVLKAAVDTVRTVALTSPDYNRALTAIRAYINGNPGAFPQYFFGEVERGFQGDDEKKCGKCGAGVPYIGKVMAAIERAYTLAPPGQTFLATDQGLIDNFNALKNNPDIKLGSRIPIADARILKLMSGWNQASILMLFKLLADYKRTGDYQQIYAVLYAILVAGSNIGNFTFSSGDELAALLSRLCAIPTILQVASIGKTTLYRNQEMVGDSTAQERSQKEKIVKLTEAYILDFDKNFAIILSFIMRNYAQVCELRNQLAELCGVGGDGEPKGFLKGNLFYILQVLNAIHKLNTLIKLSNAAFNPEFEGNIMSLLEGYSQITTLRTQGVDISQIGIDGFTEMVRSIELIKGSELFTLSGFIKEKLPGLSFDTSEDEKTVFAEGDFTLASGNFTIPWLNLVYKSGDSKDKKLKGLSETYQQRLRAEHRSRPIAMKRGEEEKFVMECNSFLQDLTLGELVYYTGLDEEVEILKKAEEAGLQPGSNEGVNVALEDAAKIEESKSAFANYRVENVTQIMGAADTSENSLQGFKTKVYPLLLQECIATSCVDLTGVVTYLNEFAKMMRRAGVMQSKTEEVLTSAFAQAGSSTREEGQAGGTKIIQVGGATPFTNIRYLCSSINEVVLKILSKCHSYMVDAFRNQIKPQFTDPSDFENFSKALCIIQEDYEIHEFCEELLAGEDGLIASLDFIVAGFVQGDFNGDDNDVTPITLMTILTNSGLSESINILIYMLAASLHTKDQADFFSYIPTEILPPEITSFYGLCKSCNASFTVATLAIIYQIYYKGGTPFSSYTQTNFIPTIIGTLQITDGYFGYQISNKAFLTGNPVSPCNLYNLLDNIIIYFGSELFKSIPQSIPPQCSASVESEAVEPDAVESEAAGLPRVTRARAATQGTDIYGRTKAELGPYEYPARGLRPGGNFVTGSKRKSQSRVGGKKPKSTRRNKKTKLRKTYKKKAIKIKKNTYRKRLMKRTKKNKTRKYRHK